MKKILYISNIEVPYRTEFFNQLSKKVDLTVLYEREKSVNRDKKWVKSNSSIYKKEYLNGIKYKKEYSIDLRILKYIFSKKYDKVIIGCYNSISQMLAILFMKMFRKKYILNLDGEYFLDGNSLKNIIKRFFIKGADEYLIAGEVSAKNLAKYVKKEKIHPYYFSSLTEKEIKENSKNKNSGKSNFILVVGQFLNYKGLDIALDVAALDSKIKYKFVGSGFKSEELKKYILDKKISNVEVIDFLSKKDLYKEYQNCKLFLLTSRQECWGLVINEAASFGTPIISTMRVGASQEFLIPKFEKFISKSLDPNEIYNIIKNNINSNLENYKNYLIDKTQKYSIEKSVEITYKILNK